MGILPETLRRHPRARRTSHPILSFSGVQAERFLAAQTLADPFGPLAALADADGWVLLLGVDHTVNTSIHYAEQLAGRRQFIRWALLPDRVVECPRFPGDSTGFGTIAVDLAEAVRQVRIGSALVQAMPIRAITRAVAARLQQDPTALLCTQADCLRCRAVRQSVGVPALGG
jgi:aminoglycoside 3-N-acetyltransferase